MKSRILYNILSIVSPLIKDEQYIRWKWNTKNGGNLNIREPKTFNEKLNWLKLYDRNPLYTIMADKYTVKQYIEEKTKGELLTAKCLGVWDKAEDIQFEQLPDRFVLKCTHDSGSMVLCQDKSNLDIPETKKQLDNGVKKDFYLASREWPYKSIKKRILAEEFLGGGQPLQDYKFWCFNGKPIFMYVTNKVGTIYENFYDMEFNQVDINHGFTRLKPEFNKPLHFEKMKVFAETLSAAIPFVRIDFWEIEGNVYFGEFTFYDWGGFRPFSDYQQDLELGKLLELPQL